MTELLLTTTSPAETEALGRLLGSLLIPGDCLALQGGLGGGKTCFTRGVVAAVAPRSAHQVASPTFAIMSLYDDVTPVYHFDFYRLGGDGDVIELGFDDYFHGTGVCVVEWSERLSTLLPGDHVTVAFEYQPDDIRQIRCSFSGPRSAAIIEQLAQLV